MQRYRALKTMLLLPGALALLLQPAAAAGRGQVVAGLKTGLNLADFVGNDADPGAGSTKAQKAGFAIGGYVIFPVNRYFKVQPEFLISGKGAVYKSSVLGVHYESRIKLTYLEIPVLARFDIESRSGAKPAILVGPSFGIKVSAQSESRAIGSSSTDTAENIKTLDPGIVLGGVVEIPAGAGAFSLEARYTRSLVTISESTGGRTPDIRNSVISIMLGYRF